MTSDSAERQPRLVDWDEAGRWADGIRSRNETVVFTNGCFDLIHPGHVHLLERAAALGNGLIIGLNSDASIRRLKGPGRPLLDEMARVGLLLAMRWVDRVVLFDEDTPLRLIRHIRPQVLVKGGDYRPETVVGAADVREWGGDVVIIPLLPGFSTTTLAEKLRRSRPL